jgi:hypothetical protein
MRAMPREQSREQPKRASQEVHPKRVIQESHETMQNTCRQSWWVGGVVVVISRANHHSPTAAPNYGCVGMGGDEWGWGAHHGRRCRSLQNPSETQGGGPGQLIQYN